MSNVGNKITELRLAQNMSLTGLAKNSDIAQSSLSYIESSKAQPTVETLQKICSALGITLGEFFSDEPPELSPELRRLLDTAKELSPEQLDTLQSFLNAMKGDVS